MATKFGIAMSGNYEVRVNGTPEYVRSCCEASLKRLDVSYIDLYYQHRVDVSVPIEDTVSIQRLFAFPFFILSIQISLNVDGYLFGTNYLFGRKDGGA